jgi:hypothetical protein
MQSYSNPESRNTMRAAGNPMKTGAAIGGGGNQTQGAGHAALAKCPCPCLAQTQLSPMYKVPSRQA